MPKTGQWYHISSFKNGSPTPLKTMCLSLFVSIMSIRDEECSVKWVVLSIACARETAHKYFRFYVMSVR